jgi:hypothetical protein
MNLPFRETLLPVAPGIDFRGRFLRVKRILARGDPVDGREQFEPERCFKPLDQLADPFESADRVALIF